MIPIPISIPMRVAVSEHTVPMRVATDEAEIALSLGVTYVNVSGENYEGEYTVTPRLYEQQLETNGKIMRDDVTVYEIPISRVSNPYDGVTVLIG